MDWTNFSFISITTIFFWLISIVTLIPSKKNLTGLTFIFLSLGIGVFLFFIISFWVLLSRPPLQTIGETRLWYTLFLSLIGFFIYYKWRYKWFLVYSLLMASLFMLINYLHPEVQEKILMPALQSIWFVPHVLVYMSAYAFLAAASLVALKALYEYYFRELKKETVKLADNLVYLGFAFLTLGLLFGAIWAKDIWGNYWTWDPKETWAFLTWLIYLVYIHLRHHKPQKIMLSLWILAFSFLVLLICWFGINYLPTAQNSVHTYSSR